MLYLRGWSASLAFRGPGFSTKYRKGMKKWERKKASQAENTAWAMALKCVGIRVCKRLKVITKAVVASHSPWLPVKRSWASAKDAE